MLFNSFVFLIFGAVFFAIWLYLRRTDSTRWAYLVVASFFFYGWWDWRFLILIVVSGMIDFLAGLGMERYPDRRRAFLIFSILGNVGSLAAFKYSGFIAENLEWMAGQLGYELSLKSGLPEIMLVVPIGISFYTFQSMSYTIDVYRGQLKPTHHLLHFFAYLSLFPQLVAGPIIRARDFLGQLMVAGKATEQQRYDGLRLIVHGYFKKVVIADNLAPIINSAFSSANMESSTIYWWIIISMFAFQIYCDFSGYSDIARGLAKWMGYEFQLNFNHPYISTSLREFWTRWHISLSSWFRDYVYVPLGGSRLGQLKEYRNIWVTMLVSGLWHGAAWTFVMWAAIHAFFISLERLSSWTKYLQRIPGGKIIATTIILVQVWIAWVFFRAESFAQAVLIVRNMFSFDFSPFMVEDWVLFYKALALMALAAGREIYFAFGIDRMRPVTPRTRLLADQITIVAMMAACVFLRGPGSAFIYFQF